MLFYVRTGFVFSMFLHTSCLRTRFVPVCYHVSYEPIEDHDTHAYIVILYLCPACTLCVK